jgi:hypothetical protein
MFKVLKRSLFGAFLPHLDTAPQKFPQLAIPLNHMAVSINDWERAFMSATPTRISCGEDNCTFLLPARRARQHERAKTATTNLRNWIDKQHTTPIVLMDYCQ